MSTPTLAQLLQVITPEQAYQALLGVYQSEDFPITAWPAGGVDATRTLAYATVLSDLVLNYVPNIAGGGYLSTAATDWLRLLASEIFQLPYLAATNTIGEPVLAAAGGSGPYTFGVGDLRINFATSRNRYVNLDAGTIPSGGSLTGIRFQAEKPGSSYNDPSNSTDITLVDSLPGVTVTNPAETYSTVDHIGAGTGSVTPSGSPVAPHRVVVSIDSSGAVGAASWSYQLDGEAIVSVGALSTYTIPGTNITITLANGGSGTSFVEGDTYTFQTPGSWITVQGTDDEVDPALIQRCVDRWALQSGIAALDYYDFLARNTPGVMGQVTQSIVLTDPNINNRINIVVSGPQGVLPAGVVTAIRTYIGSRPAICDNPNVTSPSVENITLAGAVTVTFKALVAAQIAIQTAMSDYINGGGINPTYRIAKIIDLVMNVAGVVDFSGLTINGVAANLTLGDSSTFLVGSLQPLGFSYISVPG